MTRRVKRIFSMTAVMVVLAGVIATLVVVVHPSGGSEKPAELTTASQPRAPQAPHKPPRKVKAFSDGCNHGYGVVGQCIPVVAPGNRPVTCAYLTAYGYFKQPLLVRRDNLGLKKKNAQLQYRGNDTYLVSCSD